MYPYFIAYYIIRTSSGAYELNHEGASIQNLCFWMYYLVPRRPSILRIEIYIQQFCQNSTCVPVEYINNPWTSNIQLAIQPECVLPLGTSVYPPQNLLVYIALEASVNNIQVCTLRLSCYYIHTGQSKYIYLYKQF